MRNTELEKLDGLVGRWTTTLSDAWFLEPQGTTVAGMTTIEWLGESFLVVRSELGGGRHVHSEMRLILGAVTRTTGSSPSITTTAASAASTP